jgi:DNA uptake protein ComE-like DNA-binding protein
MEIVTEPFSEIFDLNTVTFEELMLIPDMKEEHALKIIELREQIGSYSHIYEILYIEGISRDTASEYMKHLEIVE